ncbi:NRK1-like protein [Mya arenaria]|uniref:NRK1-like protein n=1 Tax=Mya arenaria TaxID=6604 RepID=A0ABY7DNZ6_MYAAR|nr:NRK1-like protein [Mya arenaria]
MADCSIKRALKASSVGALTALVDRRFELFTALRKNLLGNILAGVNYFTEDVSRMEPVHDVNMAENVKIDVEQENTENTNRNSNENAPGVTIESLSVSDQPVRETTQTDHLNKQLLSAFLNKINQTGVGNSSSSEEADDWEDQPLPVFQTTNSGKSTVASKLVQLIPRSHHVCQDYYYLPPGDQRLAPIYIEKLNHHNWEEEGQAYVFIEGFSIFGWRPLSSLFDLKYFLMVDKETCWNRRQYRDYDPPDVPGYFEQYVWPLHEKHMEAIIYLGNTDSLEDRVNRILSDLKTLSGKDQPSAL